MRNFKIEETILYEDKDILVCHKPAGIAVQNAKFGTMDMESAIRNYLAVKVSGKVPYLAVIHRLDQPVEGVLVFAKTPGAAKNLSSQMAEGKMDKWYLAVTARMPDAVKEKTAWQQGDMEEGYLLKDYLKKDGRTNTSRVVPEGTPGSKEARLTYRVLQEITDERMPGGKRYLLKIHLDTGRHHQIRVQMAHAGMALVGDRKYHQEAENMQLGLCSCILSFIKPGTKKKMKFSIRPKGEAFEGFAPVEDVPE